MSFACCSVATRGLKVTSMPDSDFPGISSQSGSIDT